MAKKRKTTNERATKRQRRDEPQEEISSGGTWSGLQQETRNSVIGIFFIILAVILVFAAFKQGGYLGGKIYAGVHFLFGVGYWALPVLFLLLGFNFFKEMRRGLTTPAMIASPFFILSLLGIFALADAGRGTEGWGGFIGYYVMKPMEFLFAYTLAWVILVAIAGVSLIVLFDKPLRLHFIVSFLDLFRRKKEDEFFAEDEPGEALIAVGDDALEMKEGKGGKEIPKRGVVEVKDDDESEEGVEDEGPEEDTRPTLAEKITGKKKEEKEEAPFTFNSILHSEYTPPPLTLLEGDRGKAGGGDLKIISNTIKRTFQNFNIPVEMDEISVGPSITRYALKPAEGIKLTRITALQHNLELALAAAPVRIEAPIPGKSLVGIEVPNSVKATVGLGSLLKESVWSENHNPLFAPLGKGISGQAQFMNIAKMPHILVAGATGSGKSVTMHTIITALLYRNSPEQLRFIMVDPKRVEMTLYNGIPHLLTPVITEPKKAILSLKWAAREMDRRYEVLQENKCRDIHSYHKNVLQPKLKAYEKEKARWEEEGDEDMDPPEVPELMPYIMVVIDELADIMTAYPRELESAIVRLAQMSRAVGIHLMIATQRPSVNVITGLIKANIPARIALQVASQIDSRTIIDMAGAENLLGQGDMLFLSAEMPKPIRLQSAFISEHEVKNVVKFIKDRYEGVLGEELNLSNTENNNAFFGIPEDVFSGGGMGDDGGGDEKYEEAKAEVIRSQKASISFLQRKLKIGYSRAGSLIDMLEKNGIVGPGIGAKPRDVLVRDDMAGFGHEEEEMR